MHASPVDLMTWADFETAWGAYTRSSTSTTREVDVGGYKYHRRLLRPPSHKHDGEPFPEYWRDRRRAYRPLCPAPLQGVSISACQHWTARLLVYADTTHIIPGDMSIPSPASLAYRAGAFGLRPL